MQTLVGLPDHSRHAAMSVLLASLLVSRTILLVDTDDIFGLAPVHLTSKEIFFFSLGFALGNLKSSYRGCVQQSSCLVWTCVLEEAVCSSRMRGTAVKLCT